MKKPNSQPHSLKSVKSSKSDEAQSHSVFEKCYRLTIKDPATGKVLFQSEPTFSALEVERMAEQDLSAFFALGIEPEKGVKVDGMKWDPDQLDWTSADSRSFHRQSEAAVRASRGN